MSPSAVGLERLGSQRLSGPSPASAAEVVAHFGAMQGQDYYAALRAIALRGGIPTQSAVEAAVADRSIVRTWPLRGTLHFLAATDFRWIMDLVAPRSLASIARRSAELGLDDTVAAKSRKLFRAALEGGRQLTREELYGALEQGGVRTSEQRGYYLLWRAAQEQLICWGSRAGKEPRFALLDEWVPPASRLSREEAIARLASRYFASHGPATLADFVWWSGLPVSDARLGIELSASELYSRKICEQVYWSAADAYAASLPPSVEKGGGGKVYLLPAFDEYIVGYRDRGDVLDPGRAKLVNAGGGMLKPVLVIGGEVVGVWKRAQRKHTSTVAVSTFRKLTKMEQRDLERQAQDYGGFLGTDTALTVAQV